MSVGDVDIFEYGDVTRPVHVIFDSTQENEDVNT